MSNNINTLESELRELELLHRSDVQSLLFTLDKCKHPNIYDSLYKRLEVIIEHERLTAKRQKDLFRPYAHKSLANDGDIHICTQPNGVSYNIDVNSLTTGALVTGPIGSGKSRFISSILTQIYQKHPVRLTVIDFKGGFNNLSSQIGAKNVDLSNISLTLDPPPGVRLDDFIFEIIPLLAETTGIAYGLDLLNTAAERALKKMKYSNYTSLCLRDILEELNLIHTKSFRIGGYLDAAKTALSLLVGKSKLFSCRKGLSINDLISNNMVINARSVTSDLLARFLATYFLYFMYQDARKEPESKTLKHILCIDDANRSISKQNLGNSISSLSSILSVIRSSGRALLAASQLPNCIDSSVISLSRSMFVVGNINGTDHLNVIKSFMGTTADQTKAITQFKKREMLAFVSNSSWSKPVHGFVPFVEDLAETNPIYEDYSDVIEEWKPLTRTLDNSAIESSKTVDKMDHISTLISSSVDKLVFHCLNNPFFKASDHAKALSSIREYDSAKTKAVQEGYLLPSQAGKALYLIPTDKSYKRFNINNPSARAVSLEHSYYVNFAASILKDKGLSVRVETPVGSSGATIDLTATDKSGSSIAIECTLSTSNLLTNAILLQDSTSFQKIIWLTKDAVTAKAINSYFHTKSDILPKYLIDKFDYIHFNNFIKGKF